MCSTRCRAELIPGVGAREQEEVQYVYVCSRCVWGDKRHGAITAFQIVDCFVNDKDNEKFPLHVKRLRSSSLGESELINHAVYLR